MTNIELENRAKEMKIKNFKGVFMRDELKKLKPNIRECGIFNLNTSKEPGSHWVCWYLDKSPREAINAERNGVRIYFDSYGLVPPQELVDYLGTPILRNTEQLQNFNQSNCGQFCLYVLKRLSDGDKFQNIEIDLYNINHNGRRE
jgi:hypothetical protein